MLLTLNAVLARSKLPGVAVLDLSPFAFNNMNMVLIQAVDCILGSICGCVPFWSQILKFFLKFFVVINFGFLMNQHAGTPPILLQKWQCHQSRQSFTFVENSQEASKCPVSNSCFAPDSKISYSAATDSSTLVFVTDNRQGVKQIKRPQSF